MDARFILATGIVVLVAESASIFLLIWYARYNDRC